MQSLKEPWPPEIRERSVAAKPAVKKLHGKDKWHRYLEQNEDLRLWYESYQKNGGQTADIYLRNLMRFCINYARMTPWQYARLPLKKIETLAMKFISQMEKARNPRTGELYATEYIEKHVDAIKSWTSWNSKTIGNRKLKVAKLNPRPLASKEKLPPPEELGRLLYSATTPKRTRVVIAGTAHAGLRFMSYGDYTGMDGIRIKDFPELKIVTDENGKQKEVMFEKKPAWCRVRWNLSKTRKPYESKWSVEACDVLKDYLDHRIRNGEMLDQESGIIVTTEEDRKRQELLSLFDGSSRVIFEYQETDLDSRLNLWH